MTVETKLSEEHGDDEMTVADIARSLGKFYLDQWNTIGAPRGALVTVPAQELGDLGLQRGLHKQLGT
jgi:hypothetical protein